MSTNDGNSGRNDPGDTNAGKTFINDFSNLQDNRDTRKLAN